MFEVAKKEFFDHLARLTEKWELLGIKNERFELINTPEEISIPIGPNQFSPKELLHPQDETLMKFENKNILLPENYKLRIIFAIRPCDAFAIELLDKVFFQEPKDPYYIARRANTVFISIACKSVLPTCFCTSFDSFDPYKLYAADILFLEKDDKFILLDSSEKGAKILREFKAKENDECLEFVENSKKTLLAALEKNKVSTLNLRQRLLERFGDMNFWGRIGERCINCGICTYLCPTCYCFDIDDERIGKRVRRARIWDSCQFANFTLEASGHNPREHKLSRVRQRFMHKLSYYATSYGSYQCVGCGRCVIYCPVNIDIREIIQSA